MLLPWVEAIRHIGFDLQPFMPQTAEMILSQFNEILSSHKVVSFSAVGAVFDPHYHEAIEIEETTDAEDGKILSEFAKGYRCGDRIIRPAKVKVARKETSGEST